MPTRIGEYDVRSETEILGDLPQRWEDLGEDAAECRIGRVIYATPREVGVIAEILGDAYVLASSPQVRRWLSSDGKGCIQETDLLEALARNAAAGVTVHIKPLRLEATHLECHFLAEERRARATRTAT